MADRQRPEPEALARVRLDEVPAVVEHYVPRRGFGRVAVGIFRGVQFDFQTLDLLSKLAAFQIERHGNQWGTAWTSWQMKFADQLPKEIFLMLGSFGDLPLHRVQIIHERGVFVDATPQWQHISTIGKQIPASLDRPNFAVKGHSDHQVLLPSQAMQ